MEFGISFTKQKKRGVALIGRAVVSKTTGSRFDPWRPCQKFDTPVWSDKIELENMLTEEDIKKIIEANREVFPSKEDFESFKDEIKQGFSDLQTSVDAYAKKADTYFQEMVMLAHKVDRLEKWIQQIAEKVGIKLEH